MAHETRYGWDTEFEYVQCPNCKTTQIAEIPLDIGKYYSTQYYSMKKLSINEGNDWLHNFVRKRILRYKISHKGILGKALLKFSPDAFEWVQPHMFDFNSKIIDIGCGTGSVILKLAQCGFENDEGIDPYLQEDIVYEINSQKPLYIKKKTLNDINDKYDFIILSHVIEHMEDPCGALHKLSTIMHSHSVLMIALPLFSNFGWQQYGINSLPFADAPRHFHIFTYKGMIELAEQYGFQLIYSKPCFTERILHDAYGNYSDEVKSMNFADLKQRLLRQEDTGIAYLYFRLKQ